MFRARPPQPGVLNGTINCCPAPVAAMPLIVPATSVPENVEKFVPSHATSNDDVCP